jgi:protein-tyrosine-phosphatase/predicted ATP-grasp superfamily ATP-dependent carboligase
MSADVKPRTGRALVLDGHSSAAVESVQSLGRAGIEVDVACESGDCLAFRSRYPRQRLTQPEAAEHGRYIAWLRDLDSREGYSLIVASTENSLVALNTLAASDPSRGKALLPSAASVNIALDKQATCELAERLGVRVPRTRLIESADTESAVGYPLVLKPVRSMVETESGLRRLSAVTVRDAPERKIQLERLLQYSPVQEQSYATGVGLGVECLYDRGRMVWHFAHKRVHEVPLTGGGSSYRAAIDPPPNAVAAATSLLDSLQWHGVAMVEFKYEPDGQICLMEINPRLWGSLALAIDAGVNFPMGMWALATGASPGPQPKWRVPYYTRQLLMDVDWLKENWRAPHDDPLLLTRPRLRSFLEYARPLWLRESWDHFDFGDLSVIRHVLGRVFAENFGAVTRRVERLRTRRRVRIAHARVLSRLRSRGAAEPRILFICYGNICRSAFAECYATLAMPGIRVTSAGFHDKEGRPSPEHLVRAARPLGVNLDDWRSKRVDAAMVRNADLILVMDEENYQAMRERFPEAAERLTALGFFGPQRQFPIMDPYTLGDEQTRDVLLAIRDSIDGLGTLVGARR